MAKGEHLVVVTPTASGKTLCYNLPVLQALVQQPEARVLYLFPTKALAQDQLAELMELSKSLPDMRMFTYDGDTPQDARRSVRARANLVLTNPDMLHSGILPHHTKWVNLFQNLKYVVIDELHAYRGVFGSHLANVLRRLKRICRHYGATPQFIMASATIANPGDLAQRLTGETVVELNESGAPTGEKTFMVYNPPVVNPELGIRAPYLGEASKLATRFLKQKVATIVFCQSRLSTEVVLASIKKGVEDKTGDSGIVRGYRGGYLPLRRREVEQGLRSGDVLGVVSTSALELGIDIGHLDVAVLAGYPGTIASMWQQAGRAGRRTGESAAVMVATSSPMDQYLAAHPDYLFGASPEHARINPENPFILINHVKCAAFELPIGAEEAFGGDVSAHLAALEDEGVLHRAGEHFHWSSETYPADHISLRTVTSDNFLVIDTTARDAAQVKRRQIIAEVDWKSAFSMIYPKAIYMLEGDPFEVQELHYREDEEKVAYVKRVAVDYFTDAISAKGVWILQRFEPAGDPRAARRAGRGAGGREGRRLQEDQDGHAGERGLGRGGAAAAGDADHQRVAHAASRAARRDLPAARRPGGRAPRPDPSPPQPGPDLPAVRHPRRGGVARRRLAVPGRAGGDARDHAGPAPPGRDLHADDLPLRQPAGRHRPRRAHLRGAAGSARARARDARGLRLPERLSLVRGARERGRTPGQADRARDPQAPRGPALTPPLPWRVISPS